ncbi:DUF2975 domain-containing protein [Bengtsoniella intestinalis]|uniref:DUF2975 domain-containing protein n=1 Tax=Bengtsoniella intestinalis TaxID=3073143 RepID=UPI00391F5844
MKQLNWSHKNSMKLSRVMVILFAVALVALDIFARDVTVFLSSHLLGQAGIGLGEGLVFMVTLYVCSLPGYVLLYSLYRLIRNLEQGTVFVPQNIAYLRRSSWCCVVVAVVCVVGVPTYPSFCIITIAAGFMALIIRIIKNVFEQAILMKDELDFTV